MPLACLAGAAAGSLILPAFPAQADAARLKVRTVPAGLVVRVLRERPSPVMFALDGRPVSRVRKPPYQILLRGLHPVRRYPRGPRHLLVVRDARSGGRLGRLVLAERPRTEAPAVRPPGPVDDAAPPPQPAAPPPEPAPEKPPGDVLRPRPPAGYELPAAAVHVTTSAGLASALTTAGQTDIVLADGVYDNPTFFQNPYGHRLWAARPGGAILKAGISLGGNWGPGRGLVRGVAFDVQDPTKVLHGGIVNVWGTGSGSRLLDLTFEGHGVLAAAVVARQPEGLVVQRVVARDFTDYGLLVDANTPEATLVAPPVLEDLDLANVARPVPRSSNGRAEACLWVGNTAVVRRIRTRNCAWEGVWTGTATRGALFEDLDLDDSGIGVYMEHFTRQSTFQRMSIGPNVDTGVNCEWADPAWGGRPGCVDNVIQDSHFDTHIVGVYLDEGTTGTTVRRSVFRNQEWAAIGNYRGIDNLRDTAGNDYRRIGPDAASVSTDHLYSYRH